MNQQNKSKIFIAGGGTGGHIYPAVAVAEALKNEYEIYYVGNPRNLEKEITDKIVAIKCEVEKTICILQKNVDKKIAKSIDDTLNELCLSAQTITWEN